MTPGWLAFVASTGTSCDVLIILLPKYLELYDIICIEILEEFLCGASGFPCVGSRFSDAPQQFVSGTTRILNII